MLECIYIYIYIALDVAVKLLWCTGIQGIYAQLTEGSICLLYICIVLYLAVGVAVCKESMLDSLQGPSTFYICIVLDLAVGLVV